MAIPNTVGYPSLRPRSFEYRGVRVASTLALRHVVELFPSLGDRRPFQDRPDVERNKREAGRDQLVSTRGAELKSGIRNRNRSTSQLGGEIPNLFGLQLLE